VSDHEHVYDARVQTTRGVVSGCNDSGAAQTVDVTTHEGVVRAGVEVHLPFGFAAVPPANGAVVVVIANGGDHSDLIALPAAVPLHRLGGLAPGEVAIYAVDGTRVHCKVGGIVEILAAEQVQITAPNVTLTATGGVTVAGNLIVAENLSVQGSLSVAGNSSIGGNLTVGGTINGR
jgi:phage gp45-like